LTLGFAEVSALLGEAERLLRVGGRMAVVLWDREHPPPHEQALREALAGVGHESAFLSRVMPAVDIPASRRVSRLRDVARFDGASHAWSALVDDRPLAEEISGLDRSAVDAVRASVSTALERYAGADGTLRIPVEAMLLG